MRITGTVNRVTDLGAFLASVIVPLDATRINLAAAAPGSFAPAAGIRLHLASAGAAVGFFPPLSLKQDLGGDGQFAFDVPAQVFSPGTTLYFVAYQQTGEVTVPGGLGGSGQTIPIYQPVYRSGGFAVTASTPDLAFSLFFLDLADAGFGAMRIAQAEVDAQVAAVTVAGLNSLSARVRRGHVRVRGRGAANAELTFEVRLRPSTSSNLARLVRHDIENYELDVPFPGNLCVDAAVVESSVRDSVRELVRAVNATLLDGLIASVPDVSPVFDEQMFFERNSTLTCAALSYPITDQRIETINGIPVPIVERAVELRAMLGFPRQMTT